MTITPSDITEYITIKQGDTARIIYDDLTLSGFPIDLTGATVWLNFYEFTDSTSVARMATVTVPISGSVSYQLTEEDVATTGTKALEWTIQFQNGTALTVPTEGYILLRVVPTLE